MSIADTAYLTRAQVAQRLQLTPKTLANWTSAGKGPQCIRVGGGRVRYPLVELREWERAQPSVTEKGEQNVTGSARTWRVPSAAQTQTRQRS